VDLVARRGRVRAGRGADRVNGALGLLVRRSLRTNRRAILGLALVIALAGGVALTSIAAARRTASAFPRYLDASKTSDLAINPVADDDSGENVAPVSVEVILGFIEQARRLPEVASDATYVGLEYTFLVDREGEPFAVQPEVVGSVDGRFFSQDRVAVIDGTLPDPDAPDEVLVNRSTAALLHLGIGSSVHLVVPDLSGGAEADPANLPLLGEATAHVTGIGLFPEEVLSDDVDGSPRLLATPALTRQFLELAGSYFWQGIRLAPGVSVAQGIRAYESMLPDTYQVNVQRTDTQVDRVERAVRPVVVALAVFGGVAFLAAVVLGALGALRLMTASAGGEERALQAVGLSRSQRRTVAAAPALAASVLGSLGAAALAIALSPLGPVGAVRVVEPDPGIHVDRLVVIGGTGLAGVVLVLLTLAAAHRATRSSGIVPSFPSRPSWLLARITGLGLGPNAVVGAGHALGSAGRRDGVPSRSTVVACVASVVALASAVTFGASVRSLIDTPPDYGWAADLAVNSGGGYDYFDPEGAEQAAATDGIDGLTVAGFATVSLDDREVNAIGILPVEGEPLVTVVDGRRPTERTDIALGASTARELHVGIGDEVPAAPGPLRVVGIVALPAIGPAASSHPSLGQGALMTLDGLSEVNENAYPSLALVHLTPGLDPQREGSRIVEAVVTAMGENPPEYADFVTGLRPSEVVGLAPASRTTYLLAGGLGVAAILALGLTLGASVRRRQRTYAVLGALGVDRRGLRRTVRWQLNLVTAVALVIGLPLGVACGRVAWAAFADQLGVATGARIPLLLLGTASAGLLLLANLIGEWPARRAGRRRDALALRDG
jgi:hypothetical protein